MKPQSFRSQLPAGSALYMRLDNQPLAFPARSGSNHSTQQTLSITNLALRSAALTSRNLFILLISMIVLLGIFSTASGQSHYKFEIIAQTGVAIADSDSIPGTNPIIDLGPGPSINDFGKVAFVARDEPGIHGRVMVVNQEGIVEKNFQIPPTERIGTDVQINNQDQVVWWPFG